MIDDIPKSRGRRCFVSFLLRSDAVCSLLHHKGKGSAEGGVICTSMWTPRLPLRPACSSLSSLTLPLLRRPTTLPLPANTVAAAAPTTPAPPPPPRRIPESGPDRRPCGGAPDTSVNSTD
jgi:hypothetical protein